MDFSRYRESITQIQKLADNLSSLRNADLAEMHRLNGECLAFGEKMVKSLSSMVDEIEDGLTLILDRLDLIKKELAQVSGPEGTPGDILRLEPAWSRLSALHGSIMAIIDLSKAEADHIEKAAAAQPGPGLVAGPIQEKKDVQQLIGLARKESAAAGESAATSNPVPPIKIQKKDPQKKDQKPAALPINKGIGDAEKKLMAEITKNIEALKNNRKK